MYYDANDKGYALNIHILTKEVTRACVRGGTRREEVP